MEQNYIKNTKNLFPADSEGCWHPENNLVRDKSCMFINKSFWNHSFELNKHKHIIFEKKLFLKILISKATSPIKASSELGRWKIILTSCTSKYYSPIFFFFFLLSNWWLTARFLSIPLAFGNIVNLEKFSDRWKAFFSEDHPNDL